MKPFSRCILLLALVVTTLHGFGQQHLERLFSCAVFLRHESVKTVEFEGDRYELWLRRQMTDPSGKPVSLLRPYPEVGTGSGVVVYTEGLTQHVFLITAAHVAKGMSPSSLAIIRGHDNTSIPLELGMLAGNATNLPWVLHETADVAALLLNPDIEPTQQIRTNYAISIKAFEDVVPDREAVLTTVGFPLGLGVEGKFSPITKESSPANGLITLSRADTKTPTPMFILQDPSVGGFSGGPVFETAGLKNVGGMLVSMRGFRSIGIIHGTLSDSTGGKFAAVTPSSDVVATVEKAVKRLEKP